MKVLEEGVTLRKEKDDNETESIKHYSKNYYTDYKYNIFYEIDKNLYISWNNVNW